MAAARWTDLLDPTPDEIRAASPCALDDYAVELLTSRRLPRPTLQAHREYIVGVFLSAVVVPEADDLYFRQVGVIATSDVVVIVRRTPEHGRPFDTSGLHEELGDDATSGEIVYHLLDDVAEDYLNVVDELDAEIDELEDRVDTQPAETTRRRITRLRHDLLRVRAALGPMRDASRRVVANAVDVKDGGEIFPRDLEVEFTGVYDKFLRAIDGLDLTRDLLAGVRDYSQAKIAIDQNEIVKRLTVVASLILLPTFIVGVYGQNFFNIPELHWGYGYAFSWALILVTTLVQLWWFRRKRWI
jgi:magnesium transporter